MIYKKKLYSIQALQAEKRALSNRYLALSKDSGGDKKNKKSKKDNPITENILQSILGKSNFASIAAQILPIILPTITSKIVNVGAKKVLIKGAKEIAAGYIKWKLIEIIGKAIYKKMNSKLDEEA